MFIYLLFYSSHPSYTDVYGGFRYISKSENWSTSLKYALEKIKYDFKLPKKKGTTVWLVTWGNFFWLDLKKTAALFYI